MTSGLSGRSGTRGTHPLCSTLPRVADLAPRGHNTRRGCCFISSLTLTPGILLLDSKKPRKPGPTVRTQPETPPGSGGDRPPPARAPDSLELWFTALSAQLGAYPRTVKDGSPTLPRSEPAGGPRSRSRSCLRAPWASSQILTPSRGPRGRARPCLSCSSHSAPHLLFEAVLPRPAAPSGQGLPAPGTSMLQGPVLAERRTRGRKFPGIQVPGAQLGARPAPTGQGRDFA